MITIYSIKGEEYMPRKAIGRPLEDCRGRTFWLDLARLLALWVVIALIPIVQIVVVILCLWWPVNLYG